MNSLSMTFVLVNVLLIFVLPKRLMILPLILAACYTSLGQVITVGPANLTAMRMLIIAGLARVLFRGEKIQFKLHSLDGVIIAWAVWLLASSVFHQYVGAEVVYRLGLIVDVCGIYFLARIFVESVDSLLTLLCILAIVLVPVALEMVYEKVTSNNLFSLFGGVPSTPIIRQGKLRAQGPFSHAILAGSVGAICFPMFIGLYRHHPKHAIAGVGACVVMVAASTSSGPIMSLGMAILVLFLWPYRQRMHIFRRLIIAGYLALEVVMKDPPYFLLARIDLSGGSTGYYRARLIQSSIEHLREWWFAGTDYTRHWMVTGVPWSANHVDITNHYLKMGVFGGLPLMFLFIALLWIGFLYIGRILRQSAAFEEKYHFLLWSFGAALFTITGTGVSVCLYDNSSLLIYLILASIGSLKSVYLLRPVPAAQKESTENLLPTQYA